MQDNSLLEPLELYNSKLKDLHNQNTTDYFDELVKLSGINPEENKKTVQEYKTKLAEIEDVNKKLSKFRGLRTFIIVLIVVFLLVGVYCVYDAFFTEVPSIPMVVGIIVPIVAVAADIGFIVLIVKKINVILNNVEALKAQYEQERDQLLNKAWSQMYALNILYDWNIPSQIITKTTPLIEMDKIFDPKKYQYLHEKYGLNENNNENISTYYVQSGSILGNPFLLCKDFKQDWANYKYTGSLNIRWTETVRNSDGSVSTVTKTQTLYASVYKPVPTYDFETYLIYGNDAAPNLKFYRYPTNANKMNEKELAKYVKSGVKKLDKLSRKAVKNGEDYTRLDNDEFEVLFGGENRNNETEFRLLFTPLAQKNELNLIKSKQPYGDDFYFEKSEQLNFIQSYHSQNIDYYANPNKFITYDYEEARKTFIDYNNEYFKGLFFDLAPLISIPLYQQHKAREYIYKEEYRANITSYEHESIANSFNVNILKHPDSRTHAILKTTFNNKDNEADRVTIRANSFTTVERVDYVSVRGGDGRYHNVPVYWLEYIPVWQDTEMEIKQYECSRQGFINLSDTEEFKSFINTNSRSDAYLHERGFIAFLLAAEANPSIDSLNEILNNSKVSSTSYSADDITKMVNAAMAEAKKAMDNKNIMDESKKIKDNSEQSSEAQDDDADEDDE